MYRLAGGFLDATSGVRWAGKGARHCDGDAVYRSGDLVDGCYLGPCEGNLPIGIRNARGAIHFWGNRSFHAPAQWGHGNRAVGPAVDRIAKYEIHSSVKETGRVTKWP